MGFYQNHWERIAPRLNPLMAVGLPPSPHQTDPVLPRVERPHSPLLPMLRALKRPLDHYRRELLQGTPGSGKTTELLALVNQLHPTHLVTYLDIYEHFTGRGDPTAVDRLQPWEVLLLMGLSLYQLGRKLGIVWPEPESNAFREAIAGLAPASEKAPTVDLAKMASDLVLVMGGAVANAVAPGTGLFLQVVGKAIGSIQWPLILASRRDSLELQDEQDSKVQNLKAAVTRLALFLTQQASRRLVVVLDGLDRGNASLGNRLFRDSTLLTEIPCHLVVCAPPAFSASTARGYTARRLCNLPVIDHAHPPTPGGAGIEFLWKLWRSRAEELPDDAVQRASIEGLAWASGGLSREFIHMCRDAAELAWDDDSPITEDHVKAVVDAWRRRWEADVGIPSVVALRNAMNTLSFDESEIQTTLLDQRKLVIFPNESEWYYPHPLLTLHKLRPQ